MIEAGSGRELFASELAEEEGKVGLTSPIELLLAVNRAGFFTSPTVVNAMDGASIDLDQVYGVLKRAQLGSRLDPGIYRILLGP